MLEISILGKTVSSLCYLLRKMPPSPFLPCQATQVSTPSLSAFLIHCSIWLNLAPVPTTFQKLLTLKK